jgi:type VI secretion system protein VasD
MQNIFMPPFCAEAGEVTFSLHFRHLLFSANAYVSCASKTTNGILRIVFFLACLCVLGGCSTVSAGSIANIALEAVGLKKTGPELSDAQKPPRNVPLKLHAGDNLNADSAGRPLAVVVRLYKLRQAASFQQVPYSSFLNARAEKEALGADLLEVKEITLTPGQRFETLEKVTKEADFIGVVALFHTPAPLRWRMVFHADAAEKSGLTLGLHACAMTVGGGVAATDGDDGGRLLAPVRCN